MNSLSRTLIVCLCLTGLFSCNSSTTPTTQVSPGLPQAPQKDYTKELQRLLEAARAAEPEIAALRKSHFEISESLTLPATKDRPEAINWKERFLKFRGEELKTYEQRSQDSPEAKSLATKFLGQCIDASVRSDSPANQIEALASAVITTGSQDPMVETYAYLVRSFPQEPAPVVELRKKTEALSQRVTPDDRGLNYDVQLRRLLIQLDNWTLDGLEKTSSMEQVEHIRQLTESLVRFLERASAAEHYCVAWSYTEYYSDVLTAGQKQAFYRRVVQSEKAADWYKALAGAKILVAEGWEARGTGVSSTVSEEGWKVLQEKLVDARQLALLSWKLGPETPQPAAQMEHLVGAGADDEWGLRQWLQVAVHTKFDHEEAYTYYTNYMLPQWGGSDRALLQFARECVETGRLETRVPQLGLGQLWNQNFTHGMRTSVMRTEDARATVSLFAEQALIAIQKKEQLWVNVDDWNEAILAWLVEAGNYPLAKNWLDNCGAPFDKQGMARAGGRLDRSQQLIAACTGPASDVAIPLVASLYGEKIPDAADLPQLREKIADLKAKDPGELTGQLCHEMETIVGQYETFESGAWTDFRFTPDMAGWQRMLADQWAVVDEQTLTMTSSGSSYVYPVARFRPPYMVEVEVQAFDPQGKTLNSAAYLMAGFEWSGDSWNGDMVHIGVNPDLRDAYGTVNHHLIGFSYPQTTSRHIRIKVWPEEAECSIEGAIANQAAAAGHVMTRVAIGTHALKNDPTAYRFHNFRIRKLPYEAPIPVPVEEMDTYGQRVIDFDPTEPEGYEYQYSGHMYENNIPEAVATLEKGIQKVRRPGEMYTHLAELYLRTGRVKEAWKASHDAQKYSSSPYHHAVRVMLLACAEDSAIRDPKAALEGVALTMSDRTWQGALAQSLAQAANQQMDAAKVSLETASKLAERHPNGQTEIARYSEMIHRGEVPVIKEQTPESAPAAP